MVEEGECGEGGIGGVPKAIPLPIWRVSVAVLSLCDPGDPAMILGYVMYTGRRPGVGPQGDCIGGQVRCSGAYFIHQEVS